MSIANISREWTKIHYEHINEYPNGCRALDCWDCDFHAALYSYHEKHGNPFKNIIKSCDCGAEKASTGLHSHWCATNG